MHEDTFARRVRYARRDTFPKKILHEHKNKRYNLQNSKKRKKILPTESKVRGKKVIKNKKKV